MRAILYGSKLGQNLGSCIYRLLSFSLNNLLRNVNPAHARGSFPCLLIEPVLSNTSIGPVIDTSYTHIIKVRICAQPVCQTKTISPFTRSTDSTNTRHKPIRKRETFLVQLTSLGCSTDAKKATSANLAHTCPSHQAGVPLGEITCNLQSPDETHDLQGRSTHETGT